MSSNERILITGSGGQLGKALAREFPEAMAVERAQLDISNQRQLEQVDWTNYDVIINAAAYVNADKSEINPGRELAWSANARGPANLAGIALKHGLELIHYSSEYVFDGTEADHKEDEPMSPLSVYGQTKAAADLAVSLVPNHHILRTTWVVGEGHNFVKTMKTLADVRIDPKVVKDQFGRLTFTSELVRATRHILEQHVDSGTYNLSNSGPIRSWAEIAARVYELAGHDSSRVKPVSTDSYKADKAPFAPRPEHSDLDLSKIRHTGFISQDYDELLEDYVKSLPTVE